ncbi:MAG: ATPase, T2SS/T4P/T4SS family [Ignavibacteriaceae bacterium]
MSLYEIKIDEDLISETNEILKKYSSRIPEHYFGIDRIIFIDSMLKEMSIEEIRKLNSYVNYLLKIMLDREASDLELGGFGSDGYVWLRIYGTKNNVSELPRLTFDESAILILNIITEKQRALLLKNRNLDFSYSFDPKKGITQGVTFSEDRIRFRADAYFDVDTLALNFRSILPQLRKLDALGFHPNLIKMLSFNYIKQGLILITGVTGTGKSTTLDAIIDWHNDNVNAHIVTIASPLEYVHKSKKCLIRQREVGKDVLSFRDGVVQALRQDLDIMVIGEMRDAETIIAALEVTDTGHKVFSTLHTSSTVESIDRIIAEVDESEQIRVRNRLADVLTAVISQKLVPDLKGQLTMAKEVLIVTPSVRAAIKNNNSDEIYMMINQAADLGMITMEHDLKSLYQSKKITYETALKFANNKTLFKQITGHAL